ncbi:MAG: HAMP domain-containing histidine kinase [Gemmatimonadota bacterium]|nr:MAG: HAMP domain-containing histidine kinase [Gemmatimonadota bacterium]
MRRGRLSFVTRLFLILFVLSAVPSVALLGLATWGLRNYVELAGGGGAWGRVGDSGGELLDALRETEADSLVRAKANRHEEELSRSVGLARRWDLIAGRLSDALPWVALVLGLSLAAIAAWTARQIARGLSRPVAQVVDWADRLAREEPLPAPRPAESVGPPEFSQLRGAFRHMAERLAEGKQQALEAERLRGLTEMARRVAHELKNPLTPMMLALRQARHFAGQGKADELEESLTVISAEAGRLDEIARTFAQLGRLPTGPKSEIDLEEMLRQLISSDVPDSVTAVLRVEDSVPLLRGHLEALNRAFRNLLGNAVEALSGQIAGRIEVTIVTHETDVEVAIADNGPGILPEHAERLWDPDFTTKRRGTGLGLALVRQTVRAHDGEVTLREGEEGACFVVRLPLTAAADR